MPTIRETRESLSSTFAARKFTPRAELLPRIADAFPRQIELPPKFASSATSGVTPGVDHTLAVDNSGNAVWSGPIATTITSSRLTSNAGTNGISAAALCIEFITDAPRVAVRGSYHPAAPWWIEVDGMAASTAPIAAPGNEYMRIDWNGLRKMRRYKIFAKSGLTVQSIVVGPADTIFPPSLTDRPLVGWMGDSYSLNGPETSYTPYKLVDTCAGILGWRLRLSADGGSGYAKETAQGDGNTFLARIPNFAGLPLSAMVWAGGINDSSTGLYAAALACYQAFAAANPGVRQFAVGPWSPSSTWQTTYASRFTDIQAACAAAGVTFIDNRGWITGTGKETATVGDGNADVMISSDGTHPSIAGHEYLGTRLAYAIAAQL